MVMVFFNQPDVYSLTQTVFNSRPQIGGGSYSQDVVRLLASNPELSDLVEVLLQDRDYRISAVVPYGKNLSEIGTACVIWKKVPSSSQPQLGGKPGILR
jgi:hypothetical protein